MFNEDEEESLAQIIKTTLKSTIPWILMNLLSNFELVVNTIIVGSLNNKEIFAGYGLAIVLLNIFAFSMLYGANSAIDYLIPSLL